MNSAWLSRWNNPPAYPAMVACALIPATPKASIIYPIWLIVEYARIFLSSRETIASVAVRNAVNAPSTAITWKKTKASENPFTQYPLKNIGNSRATMNTPAFTIVAACISADTGAGPAMASGSHTCSGTCADFAMGPPNRRRIVKVIIPGLLAIFAIHVLVVRNKVRKLKVPA